MPDRSAVAEAVRVPQLSPASSTSELSERKALSHRDINLSFVDNVISDAGREFSGSLGMWGGFMRQAFIVHNQVCRVPYGGISLGWFSLSWQSTYQRENTIAHNHIRNWLGVLADSGATYTLGPHINSSLHHNYASHAGEVGLLARAGPTGPSGSGIEPVAPPHLRFHGNGFYPDDGSAFWHIHHNVAEDLHGGEWLFAWNAHDEHNLTVDNVSAAAPFASSSMPQKKLRTELRRH